MGADDASLRDHEAHREVDPMTVADWRTWTPHAVVQVFPELSPTDYEALKQDIQQQGLLEPIWLIPDGKGVHRVIIDGRHRYRACQELGIEPEALETEYNEEEILDIVTSLNLRRRHLNESQRSMIAARVKPMYQAAARERMSPTSEQPPEAYGQARDHAAKRYDVSPRSVTNAERVLQKGVPELVKAVEDGQVAVAAAAKAATLSAAEQRKLTKQVLNGDVKNMSTALRQNRISKAVEKVEKLPPVAGEYHVIVADPPWRYDHRLSDETHRGRTPYPTMSLEEIRNLVIPAAEDCALWLWTTNAYLADGSAALVAKAWGFEPKTVLTWAKNKMGVGDWLRGQTEHAILAVRGKPAIKTPTPSTLLTADVGKHSAKPDEFFKLVEKHCPGRKLEMFAVTKRKGWEQHGSELLEASKDG